MKKTVLGALAAGVLALIGLSGCDEDKASCRLDIQRNLDTGNFQAVINALEVPDSSCRDAYAENNYLLDLTAAYMGIAGIGVSDFIRIVLENNETEDTFQGFVSNLDARTGTGSLKPLNLAMQSLDEFRTDTVLCSNLNGYTFLQKDACMYLGVIATAKASISITSLTSDIDAWLNSDPSAENDVNGNNNPDDMDAASCAISYAINGMAVLPAYCQVASLQDPVDFSSGSSYESVRVDIVGLSATNVYYKLITYDGDASPIVTDGNCTATFEPCSVANGTDCYVCPVKRDANESEETVRDLVLDGLNGGVDTIVGVVGEDSDLSDDVEAYRNEMDTNGDGTVSDEELINYLSSN